MLKSTARSAFDTWWNDPRRIATAYVVDTDGTIYEPFPPACWASHLGVSSAGSLQDRRSIGIEIVNVGPLRRSADDRHVLNWWPRRSRTAPEFTTVLWSRRAGESVCSHADFREDKWDIGPAFPWERLAL